jgi:hypothetical protein
MSLMLVAVGLAGAVYLSRVGLGLPRGLTETIRGRLAFTGDCRPEAAAAGRLRQELRPGEEEVLIAGWPGFAVALFEGDLGRMILVPAAQPPWGAPVAATGILLVREERLGEWQEAWANATGSSLWVKWRVGLWTCYAKLGRAQRAK